MFTFAASPDGGSVAVSVPDGAARIFPVEGGEPRPIPGVEQGDFVLKWSRDGRSLFVGRRADRAVRIDRLDLETGRRAPWKELLPADRAGLVDIAYIDVSGDGESYVYSYRRFLSTLYLAQGLR